MMFPGDHCAYPGPWLVAPWSSWDVFLAVFIVVGLGVTVALILLTGMSKPEPTNIENEPAPEVEERKRAA